MTNDRHDAPRRDRSHAAARDAWPLTLALPDGRRADLVPGSRPARYTIDGELTTIDVTIPDELQAAGWIWHGSTLFQPYAGSGGPGVAITTCTYPPPGYPCPERGQTCIEAAYTMQRIHLAHESQRAEKVTAEQHTMEF